MPARGMLLVDLTGQTFGRLEVVSFSHRHRRRAQWQCRCECGRVITVDGANLRSGLSSSCGCKRRETLSLISTTHGQTGEPTYRIWAGVLERCRATSGRLFEYYGSRGITVCERWLSFENFLEDMGERPAGKSIDRVNNDGNYEPGNCRWATAAEQANNRRPGRARETSK